MYSQRFASPHFESAERRLSRHPVSVLAGLRQTLVIAGMLLVCGNAQAQPSAAFENLPRLLAPGQEITITDVNGRSVRGRLISIHHRGIDLRLGDGTDAVVQRFPRQEVQQVNGPVDPLWDGTVVGFSAGFVGGCINGYATFDPHGFNLLTKTAMGSCLIAGAVSGGIGAGAGALIDLAVGRHGRVLYRSPMPLVLGPDIGRGRAGLNATLRW